MSFRSACVHRLLFLLVNNLRSGKKRLRVDCSRWLSYKQNFISKKTNYFCFIFEHSPLRHTRGATPRTIPDFSNGSFFNITSVGARYVCGEFIGYVVGRTVHAPSLQRTKKSRSLSAAEMRDFSVKMFGASAWFDTLPSAPLRDQKKTKKPTLTHGLSYYECLLIKPCRCCQERQRSCGHKASSCCREQDRGTFLGRTRLASLPKSYG